MKWSPQNGVSVFIRDHRALPAPPEGHSWKPLSVPEEEVPTSPRALRSLDPPRPASRTGRSRRLLLTRHLVCGACWGSSNAPKPVLGNF